MDFLEYIMKIKGGFRCVLASLKEGMSILDKFEP